MGKGSSTTTTENKPPEWSKQLFSRSADEGMHLFDSGVGGNTYTGSTVAPLSGTTMQGVNQLAQAGQNWNTAGTRPLYQGIGQAAVSDPFVNMLTGVAGNAQAGQVGEDDFRGILERAQAPTSAAQNLSGYASGDYLKGEGNPFYRERLEREIGDSTALLNSQFSGAGRYGSPGAHQSVVAENASNMLMKGLEEDFNRQTQNQFNAVGMIDAANQGALGTQMGAASGIAGIGAGNADRSLQATGLQGNLLSQAAGLRGQGLDRAQTAANSMAGLDQQQFQNRLTGAGATLQAGGMMDQQAQRQLADEVAKWYALDNQDWTRLGLLQSAAAGSAGNYGTQVSQSRQPMDMGSMLGGFGSLLGGAKSDARLKENITPVGYRNGHILWEFTYRGSPERFRGVMAQIAMGTQPEAVFMEPDGFYAVDYAALGFPMEKI